MSQVRGEKRAIELAKKSTRTWGENQYVFVDLEEKGCFFVLDDFLLSECPSFNKKDALHVIKPTPKDKIYAEKNKPNYKRIKASHVKVKEALKKNSKKGKPENDQNPEDE